MQLRGSHLHNSLDIMTLKNVTLKKISTKEDILKCVRHYISNPHIDTNFLPADESMSFINLKGHVIRKAYAKMATDETGNVLAWLLAEKMRFQFCPLPSYKQLFYSCNEHGVKAVKLLRLLHDDLIETARSENQRMVVSGGSWNDEHNVFAKILEKYGWERRGYLAIFYL